MVKVDKFKGNRKAYNIQYLYDAKKAKHSQSRNVMCPIFLTSEEEKLFDKVATKSTKNTKRLAIEQW